MAAIVVEPDAKLDLFPHLSVIISWIHVVQSQSKHSNMTIKWTVKDSSRTDCQSTNGSTGLPVFVFDVCDCTFGKTDTNDTSLLT